MMTNKRPAAPNGPPNPNPNLQKQIHPPDTQKYNPNNPKYEGKAINFNPHAPPPKHN